MAEYDEYDDSLFENIDVSKIVLTEEEQKIFSEFDELDEVYLPFEEFRILRDRKLIKSKYGKREWSTCMSTDGICQISHAGKQLRVYQAEKKQRAKMDNIKYVITSLIAVVALILSIVSIYLQLKK